MSGDRLTPEAWDLLKQMVQLHHNAGAGNRIFVEANTLGSSGICLIFVSPAGGQETLVGLDGGALKDLVIRGLLHQDYSSGGTPNYQVSGSGVSHYTNRMFDEGGAVEQMIHEIRALPDSDPFVAAHPNVAKQLNTAFSILNGGDLDDASVSSLGGALRHSLMDLASDLTGETGKAEKPVKALRAYAQSQKDNIGSREMEVFGSLISLAETTLKLAQRPAHIRDEAEGSGGPLRGWDELRRATMTMAFLCYELHKLKGSE